MLVLCQKLHICTYNWQNFLDDQSPFFRPMAPQSGGARTTPAHNHNYKTSDLARWVRTALIDYFIDVQPVKIDRPTA